MRIIIDTNLWISFLISRKYERLDTLLFSKKCKLLFSKELLEEFIEVSKRPKLKKYISSADLKKILDTIEEYAEYVEVTSESELCRDSKDNFLLSLALEFNAKKMRYSKLKRLSILI